VFSTSDACVRLTVTGTYSTIQTKTVSRAAKINAAAVVIRQLWFIVKSNNKHIMLRLRSNTNKHGGREAP